MRLSDGFARGKNIKKAIDKANKKYPVDALKIDITTTVHVAGYYDYLMQHEEITNDIFR